jgi:AIPR protein
MNLNASIVDQQVRSIAERFGGRFSDEMAIADDERQVSAAFVLLAVKTFLDLTEEEAFDTLVEGGADFGVDGIDLSPVQDGEFTVTLVQAKYKRDLEGKANFPENGVAKMIRAVATLFDPDKAVSLNPRLEARVEEIRSLVRDGHLPRVQVVLANNGLSWASDGQQSIDRAALGSQVTWTHVNHDSIVAILQSTKPVDTTLRLTGRALIEEFAFRRVLVGKIPVSELAQLFDEHGDRLLERNIRRYLGLQGNRVNEGIAQTLRDPEEQKNFYFYNNGITVVCTQFQHNALQGENWQVKISGMQVINGGQTCRTIQHVLGTEKTKASDAEVLIRVYELPRGEDDLVRTVTYATNSQNPVDLRDLRSNDDRQKKLELSIADLGYKYRRQRSENGTGRTDLTTATVAESVLAVWRECPHQAKFRSGEHFGNLYEKIFDELNGAQAVAATLLFRIAENRRKRPKAKDPVWLPYASYFIAMVMGRELLADLGIPLKRLDHRNFEKVKELIESKGQAYHTAALRSIRAALRELYGKTSVSLQQYAATFRRGDLISKLAIRPRTKGTPVSARRVSPQTRGKRNAR